MRSGERVVVVVGWMVVMMLTTTSPLSASDNLFHPQERRSETPSSSVGCLHLDWFLKGEKLRQWREEKEREKGQFSQTRPSGNGAMLCKDHLSGISSTEHEKYLSKEISHNSARFHIHPL